MFAIRSADWEGRLERRLQSRQPLRLACIKEGRRASLLQLPARRFHIFVRCKEAGGQDVPQ